MGQEIDVEEFRPADFERFRARVAAETALLGQWMREGRLARESGIGGFEVEAWLIDGQCRPAPVNEAFLAQLNNPLVVPELARFNVEMNGTPQPLHGRALRVLEQELETTWQACRRCARSMDIDLAMIGILPTVQDQQLSLANMSRMKRYKALNEQVMRLRQGRPLRLDIHGEEHLESTHYDVMLESAATSFQIHLQVDPARAVRYYNAAHALAAPMVALSANSPYLFGKSLWQETRIPLFEQAVEVGGFGDAAFGPMRRVTFGTGYARESLLECFAENLAHFPVLLPIDLSDDPAQFSHLRLHNGTIWRWNRPLIGFEQDDCPHLRIEHRVVPAGPTVTDSIANAAVFFGLIRVLAAADEPIEKQLEFTRARDNFYAAARDGLQAQFSWAGRRMSAQTLLTETLLPLARTGLEISDIDTDSITRYLGIVEERVRSGRNGANWQRRFVATHGRDMAALTAAYVERQNSGRPVHEWDV